MAAALLLTCGQLALARPVSAARARRAAQGWLRLGAHPLNANIGSTINRVETFTDEQDQAAYYIVYLDPTGFLVVPADDDVEPIVAFVDGDTYDPSPDNPLGALVDQDLPARIAAARVVGPPAAALQAPGQPQVATSSSRAQWDRLAPEQSLAEALPPPAGLSSLPDVRVAPLVVSTWDQGSVCSGYCYNYYTPNHWVDGCTATAFAQVLRYFQFPTEGIGVVASTIYVSGVSQTAYTRGGDGQGGPYLWDEMPLNPNCTLTTTQRQAIGALCSDAGILVHMQYTSTSSGSYLSACTSAMRDVLGYGNAITGWPSLGTTLSPMVNPNLDAGHPCLLAIYNATVGHAVVIDGYGYKLGVPYHHLNMGWSGSQNAWYNLPNVDCSYRFTYMTECVYNIFPTGTGEIISGRVTDQVGNPIPNATITVEQVGGGTWSITANDKAMYVLPQVPSATSFVFTPSAADYTFEPQTVTTGTSTDYSATGNRWVDLKGTPSWPAMGLDPADGLSSTGNVGGPFTPDSMTWTVRNVGGEPIDWTASKTQSWLSLSKTAGTLAPGETDTVIVSLNATAASMTVGTYNDTVTFTNTTNGVGDTTRPIVLTIPLPDLAVTPKTGLTSSGTGGGPFTPDSTTYTLTNDGGDTLHWTAGKTQPWVTLSKTAGTLAPGESDTVTVSINSNANTLSIGDFIDTITFTNTTNNHGTTTRIVSLTVGAKWQFKTAGRVQSSPAIAPDGTIYVGSNDGNLYAVNPDGTKKWQFSTTNWVESSPTIGPDGTIYFGSMDGHLYAVNPDGTAKWQFTAVGNIYSSPTVGPDGTVYVGSLGAVLYAINPDGTKKWQSDHRQLDPVFSCDCLRRNHLHRFRQQLPLRRQSRRHRQMAVPGGRPCRFLASHRIATERSTSARSTATSMPSTRTARPSGSSRHKARLLPRHRSALTARSTSARMTTASTPSTRTAPPSGSSRQTRRSCRQPPSPATARSSSAPSINISTPSTPMARSCGSSPPEAKSSPARSSAPTP